MMPLKNFPHTTAEAIAQAPKLTEETRQLLRRAERWYHAYQQALARLETAPPHFPPIRNSSSNSEKNRGLMTWVGILIARKERSVFSRRKGKNNDFYTTGRKACRDSLSRR
jgi:hypothetical protein